MACGTCNGIGAIEDANCIIMMCPNCAGKAMILARSLTRLCTALTVLHWGPTDLADEVRVNERTARRWISGHNPTPESILAWLEDLARYIKDHPPPE